MLKHLYIENISIIKKVCLDFADNFNVIIGQTGSGKSVILDCIDLVTGGRAKSEIVRPNCQKAVILAHFENPNIVYLNQIFDDNNITVDDTIIIKRLIHSDGKSSAFICGVPVTLSLLSKICNYLIEINGQFVQGRLLESAEHLIMLDEYSHLKSKLNELSILFNAYNLAKKEYQNLLGIKEKIATDYEYNLNLVKDIKNLNFITNEDITLLEKKQNLIEQNAKLKVLEEAVDFNQQLEIIKNIKRLNKITSELRNDKNEDLKNAALVLDQAAIDFCENFDFLEDIFKKANNYEVELEKIEDRLYEIKQICRKYNVNTLELEELLASAEKLVKNSDNIDCEIEKAKKTMDKSWLDYLCIAKEVSAKRKENGQHFVAELHNELAKLKMEHARMEVVITEDEKLASQNGINSLYFAASTNPGTPVMPFNKIASGGELSRFMLAFKAVMSRKINLPSIIFDEIDSGTSGIVASMIAEYLAELSQKTQVLAVTHSHQVVKKANAVLKISKETDGIDTFVKAESLDETGVIKEIEVMIFGTESKA